MQKGSRGLNRRAAVIVNLSALVLQTLLFVAPGLLSMALSCGLKRRRPESRIMTLCQLFAFPFLNLLAYSILSLLWNGFIARAVAFLPGDAWYLLEKRSLPLLTDVFTVHDGVASFNSSEFLRPLVVAVIFVIAVLVGVVHAVFAWWWERKPGKT